MGHINRSGSQRQLPPVDSPGALTRSETLPGQSKAVSRSRSNAFSAFSDPCRRHSCRFFEVSPFGHGPVMHARVVLR